jgi:hypothetical protein
MILGGAGLEAWVGQCDNCLFCYTDVRCELCFFGFFFTVTINMCDIPLSNTLLLWFGFDMFIECLQTLFYAN